MKILVIVFVSIVVFLIILLLLPFKIKLKSYFDLVNNIGVYCFSIIGIKILCGRMSMSIDGLIVENQKHRFQGDIEKTKKATKFSRQIIKRVDFLYFDSYVDCGGDGDALNSCIMGGSFEILFSCLNSIIRNYYGVVGLRKFIKIDYDNTSLNIGIDTAISITIMDIIISWILSYKGDEQNVRKRKTKAS